MAVHVVAAVLNPLVKRKERCRPHQVPDDLDVLSVLSFTVPPFTVHDGCVNIGRREGVGLI